MAGKNTPRLVKLNERPVSTRKSIYGDLVQEFAADEDMDFAKVEGAKASALVSVKKAIVKYNLSNTITAYTSNGEVVLEKKSPPHITLKGNKHPPARTIKTTGK